MSQDLCRSLGVGLVLLGLAGGAVADGAARQPKLKTEPVYPELARKMHLMGIVKLSVTITPTGTVKNAKVIGGNPVLVESAMEAVKKWRFEPATEETTQVIEFRFGPQ